MHILQKIFTYTKCHILTFTTFTSHLILYNHNTASRTEDPGKVFGLQHLLSAVCTSKYENLYRNGNKTVYEKT